MQSLKYCLKMSMKTMGKMLVTLSRKNRTQNYGHNKRTMKRKKKSSSISAPRGDASRALLCAAATCAHTQTHAYTCVHNYRQARAVPGQSRTQARWLSKHTPTHTHSLKHMPTHTHSHKHTPTHTHTSTRLHTHTHSACQQEHAQEAFFKNG